MYFVGAFSIVSVACRYILVKICNLQLCILVYPNIFAIEALDKALNGRWSAVWVSRNLVQICFIY